MIQEAALFIASKTSFKVGVTLMVGRRTQNSPDRCSVVLESSGGGVHFDLPDRVDAVFQVITRAKTQMTARTDAWEIYRAIHGTSGWTLPVITSGVIYDAMTIEALASPQYIGEDSKRRQEYSCNYVFRVQDG